MSATPRASVVIDLLDEIRRMEDEVLYFQNRILKKRIAIAELMNGIERDRSAEPAVKAEPLKLSALVNLYLAGVNGASFCNKDVVAFAVEKEPSIDRKLTVKRVQANLDGKLRAGKIRRCPGGFQKV